MSIIVQLNPDVPPTGSDLGIVNAARKSFGRRSEWDIVGYNAMTAVMDSVRLSDYTWINSGVSGYYRKLKDKDKRLLEFLARGMTAADFDSLVWHFRNLDLDGERGDLLDDSIVEKLWEWRNTPTHDTPFNHGFFSFEVKAPIFVARHLVKHEYLIMSEYSRRYITDDVEFYTPEVWRKAAADVKQGSSDEGIEDYVSIFDFGGVAGDVYSNNKDCVDLYNHMVNSGVAPEQARMVLPQSLMTAWTWSGTLGAFANMCKLRLSPDTQYETRLVAQQVYEELKKQFPVAAPLLVEGVY